MNEPTFRERLARIEEISLRIESKLEKHVADDLAVEKRVSRLERAGIWAGGLVAGLGLNYDKLKALLFS
jgi:hypothetical protein